MRVFEMLPYFAGRSTWESVYMQATILAPEAFYMQALISKTPSCPFPNYKCTSFDVKRIQNYLSLMAVNQLILITPEVRDQANTADFLKKEGEYGIWSLYRSQIPASLVEVISQPPRFTEAKDFKSEFYDWFLDYQSGRQFLVKASPEEQNIVSQAVGGDCHPEVQVDFNQIRLHTDCVGKFHILKFAFHSTWKVSSGDKLYLTSPGFIGLIPSQTDVTLSWGHHWLWTLSNILSWCTLLAALAIWVFQWRKRQ
jgi:hypothetical protein